MESGQQLRQIARIYTDFPTKFGIPRQSGVVGTLKGKIVFEEEYRNPEALRGLEDFSHLWLLWGFSQAVRKEWTPTVRPPRLGGNTRMGVFATRSPFRPNAIGLSSVKLEGILPEEGLGHVIYVSGIDMMDGTPIYDIKPYLPAFDSHPEAKGGFTDTARMTQLQVVIPKKQQKCIPEEVRETLEKVLAQDPRPRYQKDAERVYGMEFAGLEVRFQVRDDVLRVCEVRSGKNGGISGN